MILVKNHWIERKSQQTFFYIGADYSVIWLYCLSVDIMAFPLFSIINNVIIDKCMLMYIKCCFDFWRMGFYNGLRVFVSRDIEHLINITIFFSKMILTSLIPIRSRYKCLFSHTFVSKVASPLYIHSFGDKIIILWFLFALLWVELSIFVCSLVIS